MDIVLQRILSLLPKKSDGTFVRGAKKEFAVSLGYDSGDIVSMWIKGSSESYKGKLHEIAAKYDVSVEWLRGTSDEKHPPQDSPVSAALKNFILTASESELEDVLKYIEFIQSKRG